MREGGLIAMGFHSVEARYRMLSILIVITRLAVNSYDYVSFFRQSACSVCVACVPSSSSSH